MSDLVDDQHAAPASAASHAALLAELRARIVAAGPLTFAEFLEVVLYHPEHGYYTRAGGPWVRQPDFVTGPQISPALGGCVARWIAECDALLGGPRPLHVVEMGSGDGRLLATVCEALRQHHPAVLERVEVVSIERSTAARRSQRRLPGLGAAPVRDVAGVEELGGGLVGCLYSNELLDALPFHRVVRRDDELRELLVGWRDGGLVEVEAEPTTPALADYLAEAGVELAEGQVAEIRLEVGEWMARVAGALERGYLLTADYGHPTEALYDESRRSGTLACQRRFRLHDDPFVHLGEQDITAHVDFGEVERRGRQHGLRCLGSASLQVFLLGFGAAERATSASDRRDADGWRRHLALRQLLFSELGTAHRVMVQTKGPASLDALRFGRQRL